MMNERIRELARQSGGIDMTNYTAGGITTWVGTGTPEFLEQFAQLIRADEREACAKLCEEDESGRDSGGYYAETIRARGEK